MPRDRLGAGVDMRRSGAKRKFRGTTPGQGRPNMHKLSDDELAAQQPHRAWLPADKRLSEKAATPLGGLNLIGAITDEQYEAGQRYREVVMNYRASINVPVPQRSGGKGYRCLGERQCEPCECRRRKEVYDNAFKAVIEAGQRAASAVAHVAVHDKQCPEGHMRYLSSGLDRLVRHFGLRAGGR